jgi:predicted transposase/invertase (TIGR01784 family)
MTNPGNRKKSTTRAKQEATDSVAPSIHHVHDYGYKILFSNVTIFRQLLETFVDQPWVKELDFSQAETVNHSFISKDYKKTESDIIYKLKLKNGKDAYIYVLLEFQSSVDRFISVRILNYLTSLYVSLMRSGQVKDKLPPVFPILLYNGDPKWTAPDNIADLIEHHHEIMASVLNT